MVKTSVSTNSHILKYTGMSVYSHQKKTYTISFWCWVILTWIAIWELLNTSSIWNGQTEASHLCSFFGVVCMGVWTAHALLADQKFSASAGSFEWLKDFCFQPRRPTGHTPWNTIRERAVEKNFQASLSFKLEQVKWYVCFGFFTCHTLYKFTDGKYCYKPRMSP